ncbi:toxin-antitoxin system, antitoxin component, Xre family protein [Sedimentibacter hydroxybenzoicus DSM 7310]|uniref:Toxin-antitoxin system, antitoxin component, Xre family protein n=1 Tax=Sedimentibacter hydroxybenzoicus DSM 7310 TaxID=1123245 RepID=A0A974BIH8_SEDHY|nr:toxin-antitoxin system, antitoxin component, Xre family protein [Sedimentibacter hydroxybenzoicus]NYB73412.1 toxin-antitoxin system, antitoxin component, Xre family protein [Sedimentibacter hydroxybenzoicus DSM 7310]
MTNTVELKRIIKISGLKYKVIAEKLGITYYALQKKINNINEFKASEISIMCNMLNIKDSNLKEKIFFATHVE